MTTPPAPRRTWPPHPRLVVHDIKLERQSPPDGQSRVRATVDCERNQCTLDVEVCALCPRFARIEVHEAGYVLLCRSLDALPEPECTLGTLDDDT
jgi:hypothetical protein